MARNKHWKQQLTAPLAQQLASAMRLHQAGQLDKAAQGYRQILQQHPNHVDALNLLGAVAFQLGRWDEAIAHCQKAVTLKPDFVQAHVHLGHSFKARGQVEEAIAHYQQALTLQPNWVEVHLQLGSLYQDRQQWDEAIAHYQQAIRLKPGYAEALSNLGNCFLEQLKLEEAIACYHHALKLQPHPGIYVNLGRAMEAKGDWPGAMEDYRRAIALDPNCAEAHTNLGMVLLRHEQLLDGFAEYEWRWQCAQRPPLPYTQPQWDGTAFPGQTLLIHAEQGFGDTIQFIRYVPLVKALGGQVVVECQPPLVRLLQPVEGIDHCVAKGDPLPNFDLHVPLLSLPAIFKTTVETIPTSIPYLTPPPSAALDLQDSNLKVGLVWAGKPLYQTDPSRSRTCPLAQFEPLISMPGLSFYSLQKGDPATDIAALGWQERICDWSDRLSDFADTAAAIAQLDVVISVDTAVAHLAGALGQTTWVLLPFAADWRWFTHRADSPWYPTMRLFRQPCPGDWQSVIQQLL